MRIIVALLFALLPACAMAQSRMDQLSAPSTVLSTDTIPDCQSCSASVSPTVPTLANVLAIFGGFVGARISDNTSSCAHTTDSTTIQTLYVLPCGNGGIPISANGTTFTLWAIPSTSTTLVTTNATNFPANHIFDFYAFINSGAVTYCAVAWGTSTAGSSARGSSATITTINGITVNNGTWACNNGGTAYTLTTGEATLLGTFVTSTAQNITVQFAPSAASGGAACTIGYANVYNTQPATCISRDSKGNAPGTGAWTYTSTTIAQLDGSAANQANWIDPLGAYPYSAELLIQGKSATAADNCGAGVGINSTTTFSGTVAAFAHAVEPTGGKARVDGVAPQSGGGLNYAAANQQGFNGTIVCSYWGTYTTNTPQVEGLFLTTQY
jgi:hypothetical protein